MDYNSKENITKFALNFLQSKILLYCVVFIVVLKIATSVALINFPKNIFFADITKTALESFVNQTRQSAGLPALSESSKLNIAAQLKAQNMVAENYFAHISPSGVLPWHWFSKAGYNYKYAGENLAIGFFESEEVYNAWFNSPSHKANIVNPNYKEIGTAVIGGFGPNNAIIVVQEFGSQLPLKAIAPQKKTEAPQQKPTEKPQEPKAEPISDTKQPAQQEQVLSQETEYSNFFDIPSNNISNTLYSKILNTVLYDYDWLLEGVVYGILLIVIGAIFAVILLNPIFNFKRELVFRSILIVVLLLGAAIFNKELFLFIIPHQVII
jgi:uncharacterized protein YkwD